MQTHSVISVGILEVHHGNLRVACSIEAWLDLSPEWCIHYTFGEPGCD